MTLANMQSLVASFQSAVESGLEPEIDEWLIHHDQAKQQELFPKLLEIELSWKLSQQLPISVDEYLNRFVDYAAVVREQFQLHGLATNATKPKHDDKYQTIPPTSVFNNAGTKLLQSQTMNSCAAQQFVSEQTPLPATSGRYTIQDELGRGGFGMVYKAFDEQLKRLVAIKVANPSLPVEVASLFLREAQTLASLDHSQSWRRWTMLPAKNFVRWPL